MAAVALSDTLTQSLYKFNAREQGGGRALMLKARTFHRGVAETRRNENPAYLLSAR
jgi:PHD/YefM family antitoxin component YafN of YafNO toxin-antitoxin module